jgi:hypothetical protein
VLGLIVAGGGFVVFAGDIAKVGGAGNTEDLLDDVGNFPEHWTQDDGRHGARGSAPRSTGSNHASPRILYPGAAFSVACGTGLATENPEIDRVPFLNKSGRCGSRARLNLCYA